MSARTGRPALAFVSRDLAPLSTGGIGACVAGLCETLRDRYDVTAVVSANLRPRYDAGHRIEGIRVAFVEEPEHGAIGSYYAEPHLYAARVLDVLRRLYPERGPALVEFADRLGDGVVTVQAKRAHDPFLRDTTVAVRLYGTAEIRDVHDGYLDDSFARRALFACERHALAEADRVIAPCDGVLADYRHFYDGALAPATQIRPTVPGTGPRATSAGDGPLRLLYLGRLARGAGVQDIVRARTGSERSDWTLTIAGPDTDTAPLGMSMRDQLTLAAGSPPAVALSGPVAGEDVAGLLDAHDVLVYPVRWAAWPAAALEALARNRPVLATAVGGLPDILADPGAGWLTRAVGAEALLESIEELLDDRERVRDAIESGAPRRAYERLVDPAAIHAGYAGLLDEPAPAHPATERPLVSVVVPYYKMDRHVEDTLRSVAAQDYEPIEVWVVNDGSLRAEDAVLTDLGERYDVRLVTQENAGLSRARNTGIALSSGRYVLPLDSDNMLEPTFVTRCVELLEREPAVPFATAWLQHVDEYGTRFGGLEAGVQPLGNTTPAVLADNVAGDGTAVLRRELFDAGFGYDPHLTSYEDWQLYRELHVAGLHGRVIPERLVRYRVRRDSMVRDVGLRRHGRIYGEMQALLRERRQRAEPAEARSAGRLPAVEEPALATAKTVLLRENARLAQGRLGVADAAAGALIARVQEDLRERAESAERRVVDLEAEVVHLRHLARLLEAPRHQAVERLRERVMRHAGAYRRVRRLWTRSGGR